METCKAEVLAGKIKEKFFDIRKNYFHSRTGKDVTKNAVRVLQTYATLFDIMQPISDSDLNWLLTTSHSVMVKELSYLDAPNFLLYDIISLVEELKQEEDVTAARIADATKWTFDSIRRTIKPVSEVKESRRSRKKK